MIHQNLWIQCFSALETVFKCCMNPGQAVRLRANQISPTAHQPSYFTGPLQSVISTLVSPVSSCVVTVSSTRGCPRVCRRHSTVSTRASVRQCDTAADSCVDTVPAVTVWHCRPYSVLHKTMKTFSHNKQGRRYCGLGVLTP